MKLKLYILIFSLAVVLIPFRVVFGGESGIEGEVAVKGQLAHVNGNEAKFNEYGDIKDGIYGNIGLNHESERYFLKFNADEIGYDTQKYMIEGGMWGKFKYNMYYMEIPHNITFDAKTFLSGSGRDKLSGDETSDISTWHKFDYSTERKRYGAGLKFDMLHPFFIDLEVQREEKSGIKVAGGPISLFNSVEAPEPIDYTTDTFNVEAGYNKKPFYASVSYSYSKFEDDNKSLLVTSTFTSLTNALTLPPDNDYHRIGFKGYVMLPLNSKFSTNIGISEAKSDFKLIEFDGTSLGQTFDGKIKSKNYDFVLTSNPVSLFDGKIYYKYYRDKNESDELDDGSILGSIVNERLSYKKTSYGVQLGFRLPKNLKLTPKYAHMDTEFDDRHDVDNRKDDTYGLDLNWTGLDFLTVNAGYERMNRRTDRPGVAPGEEIEKYLGRFDVSPYDRDTYKVSFDVNPIDDLDISLGYKYKKTDYNDTEIGLRDDKRDEYYIAANYVVGRMVKLFGYFDYEKVRAEQFHRVYDPGNENPSLPQDTANYNWDVVHEEKNYDYGIGSDIYVIPGKLTLMLQYDNVKSDGNADFAYLFAGAIPAGATNSSIDISNSDDYRRQSVSVKAVYNVLKPLTVTAGYAYEQYKFSDTQLNDYLYTGATGSTLLTGAFKNLSYNANVVFVTAAYKF